MCPRASPSSDRYRARRTLWFVLRWVRWNCESTRRETVRRRRPAGNTRWLTPMPRRDRLLIEENWFSFSASSTTTLLRLIERQSSLLSSSSSCIRFATRLLIIVNTGIFVSLSDKQSGKGLRCSRRTSSQRWFGGVTVESVWSNRLIRWSEGHSYEDEGEGEGERWVGWTNRWGLRSCLHRMTRFMRSKSLGETCSFARSNQHVESVVFQFRACDESCCRHLWFVRQPRRSNDVTLVYNCVWRGDDDDFWKRGENWSMSTVERTRIYISSAIQWSVINQLERHWGEAKEKEHSLFILNHRAMFSSTDID